MSKKNARSPRRIHLDHEALQPIPLDDKAPPPHESVSWKLWLDCQDLAGEALKSEYVQGIAKGTLDPNRYGQYTVQDAVYCHHGQDDYRRIEERAAEAGEAALAAFAKARYDNYVVYDRETFAAWHIRDAGAVAPSSAARRYIDFEHRVATAFEPVYGVVAMIPCDQLWAFLATELAGDAGPANLYSFWIEENADWGGAYRLDNFVDDWFAEHGEAYDPAPALFVYRSCMTCEVNLFRSACGQALLPMPEPPGS